MIKRESERVIISMTTWSKRISNLPAVLNTIVNQTVRPDKIIINISEDEFVPQEILNYVESIDAELYSVPDTKVYKKLIPTLYRYPHDCIITIDDDWLYPDDMVSLLMETHMRYPDFPVSGNCAVKHRLQCHCGCASLVKACFFGSYIDCIDSEVMSKCPSDDIVYTYMAYKSGHPYIRTIEPLFSKLIPYNNENSYSSASVDGGGIENSYQYLVARFGDIDLSTIYYNYVSDSYFLSLLSDIHNKSIEDAKEIGRLFGREEIINSKRYRVGDTLFKPIITTNQLLNSIFRKRKE